MAAKKNLFILRHGLAVEAGTAGYATDADRPLTAEGKAKLRDIAAAMQAGGITSVVLFRIAQDAVPIEKVGDIVRFRSEIRQRAEAEGLCLQAAGCCLIANPV